MSGFMIDHYCVCRVLHCELISESHVIPLSFFHSKLGVNSVSGIIGGYYQLMYRYNLYIKYYWDCKAFQTMVIMHIIIRWL